MERKSIETLHRTKTGKVSDKWASYLPHYDELFGPLRDRPVSMLEIGVQNGGSLETWSAFFEAAETIIGCDINPKCAVLRYDDPRVKVVVDNANSVSGFQKITSHASSFDIVIDDGSHQSTDILNSFITYFPLVKPGGVYVVEDACCLYLNEFGGGLLNDFGAYSFFKRMVDVISFQFWKNDLGINHYLRTFFELKSTPPFILEGWVQSIEFKNSLITIKKALHPGHEKLGEQVIVGNVADVYNLGFWSAENK